MALIESRPYAPVVDTPRLDSPVGNLAIEELLLVKLTTSVPGGGATGGSLAGTGVC